MASRKRVNPIADKVANVVLHRNGLSIEIVGVPAVDAALVAAELLDAVRGLVKAGYDELIPDAGSTHAGPFGEATDEDHAEQGKHRMGFTIAPDARPR